MARFGELAGNDGEQATHLIAQAKRGSGPIRVSIAKSVADVQQCFYLIERSARAGEKLEILCAMSATVPFCDICRN